MGSFVYLIQAPNESIGNYVKHLFKVHGMLYPWVVEQSSLGSRNTIRIAISKASQGDSLNPRNSQKVSPLSLVFEMYFTTDINILILVGMNIKEKERTNKYSWGYIVSDRDNNGALPVHTFPIPLQGVQEINSLSKDWSIRHYLCGETSLLSPFAAMRVNKGVKQGVVCIDLITCLQYSMLGPGDDAEGQFEEWADVYGSIGTQAVANVAYIDELINLLIEMLVEMSWEAFPVRIGYYPPGKAAPLVITGDSDNSTTEQVDSYLSALEMKGIHATLIMKNYKGYDQGCLRDALSRKHCFGIHPYSEHGIVEEYVDNFRCLSAAHANILGSPICAVRNHHFQ